MAWTPTIIIILKCNNTVVIKEREVWEPREVRQSSPLHTAGLSEVHFRTAFKNLQAVRNLAEHKDTKEIQDQLTRVNVWEQGLEGWLCS